jgi:heat shock protein HtpX
MNNQLKTILLLGVLTAILVWIGGLWGRNVAIVMLIVALAINSFAYWRGDKVALAMCRAKEVSPDEAPVLFRVVKELAMRDNLPAPKVYIYQSDNPNAFATGRDPNHASVAVSTGILDILSEQELKGVLAHELSHVKNRDILVATCAATLALAITLLAHMIRWAAIFGGGGRDRQGNALSLVGMLVMVLLAPIAAALVQMAVSRSREYMADSSGAKLSGNPMFLANALRKLETAGKTRPMLNANPATSHLFIVNPFSLRGLSSLFSTHPPTEERIARLEKMII